MERIFNSYLTDRFIAFYIAFKDQVYSPQSVLYTSCGFDSGPARVFDKVIFVDSEKENSGCIQKLQEEGLSAFNLDIRNYTPTEEHDLLILLNPAIPTEWASRHLKSGGFILANNIYGNASEMYRNPDQFTLYGVINLVEREMNSDKQIAVVSMNLEGLFEPVNDEEELNRLRPEFYAFLQREFTSLAKKSNFNTDRPFKQLWADYGNMIVKETYRDMVWENMPSKRTADRYIFIKI